MAIIMRILLPNKKYMFSLCAALSLLRFGAFGFKYAPVLDDFLQYGVYPKMPDVWSSVLAGGAGTIYTRPLAALADIFIWGKMWGCLGAAVAVLAILYAASGCLFRKSGELLGLTLSPWFLIIYIFLPLNTEGTYWLSASTRIVPPLFFASVSVYSLAMYLEKGEKKQLAVCALTCFLSCGFYEQVAVLSCTALILILIFKKRPELLWIPLLNLAALAAYYLIFGKMGNNSDRMAMAPMSEFLPHTAAVIRDLRQIFTVHSVRLIKNGAVRGLDIEIMRQFFVGGIAALALVLLWGKAMYSEGESEPLTVRDFFIRLGIGIFLAAAAISPFFITKSVWLNFRNIVPMMLGLGIAADAIIRFFPCGRVTRGVLGAAVLALCLTVSMSEAADYSTTGQLDCSVALEIANQLKESDEGDLKFTVDIPAYTKQNAPYRDHIMSIFASYWGGSSAVRAVCDSPIVPFSSLQIEREAQPSSPLR